MKQISRAKFENIAYLTMNILNVAVYLLILSSSVLKAKDGTLTDIIQTIYCSVICLFLVFHEVAKPITLTTVYFGFLSLHRGKGLMMLFLGCLIMCGIIFNIIISIVAFTLGFAYILLSLVSNIPPPSSFLIHWQNYKDFWAESSDLGGPRTTLPMRSLVMPPPPHLPNCSAWDPEVPHVSCRREIPSRLSNRSATSLGALSWLALFNLSLLFGLEAITSSAFSNDACCCW